MSQHSVASNTSLNGFRVLLVEDTWIIAQSYAALLEPLGVHVIGPAVNARAARQLLDESDLDAALVDMNLQGELAHELIDLFNERNIPVVVVSGYEFVPRLEPKVVTVLKKPIRAEHLLRTLREIAKGLAPAQPSAVVQQSH